MPTRQQDNDFAELMKEQVEVRPISLDVAIEWIASCEAAGEVFGYDKRQIQRMLSGERPNKTNLRYVKPLKKKAHLLM